MKKLRVGIFGVGHLGKFHINNWLEIPEAEISGFYDPDDKNAMLAIEKYGIKRYDDVQSLLAVSDAVDIVSPTVYHFEIASAALRNGCHVFVEKPLVNTMQEARELVKLTKESSLKLQVGHVERFNPALLSLKGVQLEPMFIEVHRLSQFNPRGTDVSVILDLMIHDLDIILHLVKSNISRISANGVAVMSDTPDIANVRLEFDNGCVANLTSSRISMKKMRKMRLFQRDAYIGIDFLEKKTEIIKHNTEDEQNVFTFDIETNTGKKRISIMNPQVEDSNAIKSELRSFVDAIMHNKPVAVSVNDGFAAMEVAHKILDIISSHQT